MHIYIHAHSFYIFIYTTLVDYVLTRYGIVASLPAIFKSKVTEWNSSVTHHEASWSWSMGNVMTLEISEDMILLTQIYMVNVLNIVFFKKLSCFGFGSNFVFAKHYVQHARDVTVPWQELLILIDVVSEGSNWRLRIPLNTYQLKQLDEASRTLSKTTCHYQLLCAFI